MSIKDNYDTFLSLVRLGIGHSLNTTNKDFDWKTIRTLADLQGLYAVILDGIEKLPEKSKPQKEVLLEWIGEVLQGYEYRYVDYKKAIAEMAKFYNAHAYKMMILKGYACSLNWPKPEHRPCGDIDIWQFGIQKEADAILSREKGIKIDTSQHHHTVFYWSDFMVENHYDFINVKAHRSHSGLEKVFKELGEDDSYFVKVFDEKVYLPSPNLHALFLIRHALNHFTSIGINLRQILDWAFFVEKHTKEIDWEWLTRTLGEYRMKDFFDCINAICVEDLGFSPSIFPVVQCNPRIKERILNDIFDPTFAVPEPRSLIPRLIYKYRRWRGNAWKRQICYNESMWSAFWSGVWSHILKPSSI